VLEAYDVLAINARRQGLKMNGGKGFLWSHELILLNNYDYGKMELRFDLGLFLPFGQL